MLVFCLQTYFREFKRRKIITFTQIFKSFLPVSCSFCLKILLQRFFKNRSASDVAPQFHLGMSLFHLQCLQICLLNIELSVEESFISAVKKYYFTSFLTSTVSDEKLQSLELLFPYKQCIIFFSYIQDFIVFLSLVLSNLTVLFLGMELCGCFLFEVC